MEKKEAQYFIIQRLSLGYEKKEIVDELTQQLKAPSDLVMRFVDQVSKSHLQAQKKDIHASTKSDQPVSFDDGLNVQIKSDKPPYLEDDTPSEEPNPIGSTSPMCEDKYPWGVKMDTHNLEESEDIPSQNQVDLEELEQFILQGFKTHRRHSDMVQIICEKTGWSWNKSQRFVARIQTKSHNELTRSNRSFMIPFSSVFIIGGLLLLLWSTMTLIDYYNGWTGRSTSTLPLDFIVLIIGGVFTSFGIIAGGILGLYRTLSN